MARNTVSRYLVTGASGFFGSHLVDQLCEAGHEVVALQFEPLVGEAPERVTFLRGDVLDGASVEAAAAGCDGAFHCAGMVSRSQADAEAMYRVHVDGTKTTLAALRAAGVKRVVVASTSGTIAVSEDPNAIADEDTEAPMEAITRWPYYRSKLYAERVALDASDAELEVVCVNPTLLLGPGDLRGSSTEDVRKFLERRIPFCPGGGIAFVDARDAAAAMILAMDRGRPARRYLVSAANMTLETFFGRLERLSGVAAPPLRLPRTSPLLAGIGAELFERAAKALGVTPAMDRGSAEMAQYYWYCSAQRAKSELGWEHRDPNDTIHDTIQDLRDRGVVWPS